MVVVLLMSMVYVETITTGIVQYMLMIKINIFKAFYQYQTTSMAVPKPAINEPHY